MRVSRLYTPAPLATGKLIELDDDNGHYVRTVLRLKKDDPIILFNGHGGEYFSTVAEVSRKAVLIAIGQWSDRSVESSLQVILGLGISRGDRMDLTVQKAVELGVNHITPLLTERCVVQFKGEKKPQRLLHWQKIVQHAAEQSGRTLLPALPEVETLQDWVINQQGLKVFLDPYAETIINGFKTRSNESNLTHRPRRRFFRSGTGHSASLRLYTSPLGRSHIKNRNRIHCRLSRCAAVMGRFWQRK